MDVFPERLPLILAWLVATFVIFKGWQRYRPRGGGIALLGFALILASAIFSVSGLLAIRSLDVSRLVQSIILSILGIPGFVGTILIVCGFWVAGRSATPTAVDGEGR